MNNNSVHSLRQLVAFLPALGFLAMVGCATTADDDEVMSEATPVTESSPITGEEPAPVSTEPVVAPKPAAALVLADNYPERYVVAKGDTLWGISERFLRDPWRWPEVWQGNPYVANPHLIFPGDALMVVMIDGKPVMQVERGEVAKAAGVTEETPPLPVVEEKKAPVVEEKKAPVDVVAVERRPVDSSGKPLKVVKLKPQVREIDLEKAIPVIPMDAIRQFLNQSMVVDLKDMKHAPYVVDFADEHMSGGAGYRIYARGIKDDEIGNYMVIRPNKEYVDPDTGEKLGHEALFLANAQIERMTDPVTMALKKSSREVLRGDRLVPGTVDPIEHSFMPHAPDHEVKGRIISAFDAVNQFAQHHVVVINLGQRNGMESGHVLAVFQDGKKVRDPVTGGTVKLPDERAGLLMVFRTFEKVSYALVVRSNRAVHLNDRVQNP